MLRNFATTTPRISTYAGIPPLPGCIRRLRHSDAELPRILFWPEVPAADPAGWVLSGTHDGRKWVELDRREGCVFCSRFQEITGRIAEPSNYTAYKIEFLPREEADTVAVGDVRFYERDREEAWSGFVYPAVDFEVL